MRILVAEDQQLLANLIQEVLEDEEYSADVMHDGTNALSAATSGRYDFLVLDVMLPGLDGLSICRQLRKQGNGIPVLMLTARDSLEDRVEGLDAGADDYLVKPFAFDELLARIRAIMRRHNGQATGSDSAPGSSQGQDVLRLADLSLDPSAHEVWRDGELLTLTPKEFALLELLMRHPNQVLSRDQILRHVWGYEDDAGENYVDTYIYQLRQKVDRPFGSSLIQTVRGVGYKISRRHAERDEDHV